MPTNQQRREAAKRKLQRQLVRREEQRARRRRTTLIVGSVAVVLIAAGVVLAITTSNKESDTAAAVDNSSASSAEETTASSSEGPVAPCTYTAGGTAAKDVKPPTNTSPEQTGKVAVTMSLNGETVDVSLDRALAPCSVSSFLSLASQGFYDNTTCTRLTKSDALNVLQCGDPSGKGNGGPGYSYEPTPPTADNPYPVGTLAMANVASSQGAAEEGSQFFIAYGTTKIPASYSVIGTVSAAGMKVVDAITSQGVKDDRQDGAPNAAAKIESIKVPEEAVTASTVWTTASEDPNSGAIDSNGAVPSGSESVSSSGAESTTGAPSTTDSTSDAPSTGSGESSSSVVQTTTN